MSIPQLDVPDIAGNYLRGMQAKAFTDQQEQQNALAAALQQYGAAASQGDQNALAQLARYDPQMVSGLMGDQQQMDLRGRADARASTESQHGMADMDARLAMARQQSAAAMEEHAAQMDAAQRQKAAEHADRVAAAATQITTPEQWDEYFGREEGTKKMVGHFADKDIILAQSLGVKDALSLNAPPEALSPEGKFAADQRAGYLAPDAQPKPTDDQTEYGFAKAQGYKGTFEQWQTKNRPVTNSIGTPPAGYKIDYDEQGSPVSMSPLPGSPAAREAELASKTFAAKTGRQETSTGVIIDAAQKARDLIGFGSTGVVGQVAGKIGQSDAAEVQRQVGVLKSIATIENLQAMRNSSPTGAALGSVTQQENQMLAAAAGALDPNAGPDRFAQQLDDYERTVLRIVHGPEEGDRVFNETRGDGGAYAPPPEVMSVLKDSRPGTRIQAPDGAILEWDGSKLAPVN